MFSLFHSQVARKAIQLLSLISLSQFLLQTYQFSVLHTGQVLRAWRDGGGGGGGGGRSRDGTSIPSCFIIYSLP